MQWIGLHRRHGAGRLLDYPHPSPLPHGRGSRHPWRRWRAAHFLALGAVIFAALRLVPPPREARPVITAASRDAADDEILLHEALAIGLDRRDAVVRARLTTLGRDLGLAPADDAAALEREARALDLQRSDPLVRRHLIGMMRLAAAATGTRPDDDALRADYAAQAAALALPPRITFTHLYFSRERRGSAVADDAAALLGALATAPAGAAAVPAGDPFVAGPHIRGAAAPAIGRDFGPSFAAAVFALPVGRWSGPIESPYGLHLVRVEEHRPAEPPPFESVRARLLHARLRAEGASRLQTTLESLRQRYEVHLAVSRYR